VQQQKPIQWIANMSVGDESLDREHRELIDIINLIGEALASASANRHTALINQLLSAAREHFEHEEQALLRTGYPEYARHVQEHRRLMDRIVTLADIEEISPRVLQLLRDWLIEHVYEHDRAYASFLKGLSGG
jgi:hemerythrin-like metal-binding protein